MEHTHKITRTKVIVWSAPSKEQRFRELWDKITTETKAMQQNEINRNTETHEKRSLAVI